MHATNTIVDLTVNSLMLPSFVSRSTVFTDTLTESSCLSEYASKSEGSWVAAIKQQHIAPN